MRHSIVDCYVSTPVLSFVTAVMPSIKRLAQREMKREIMPGSLRLTGKYIKPLRVLFRSTGQNNNLVSEEALRNIATQHSPSACNLCARRLKRALTDSAIRREYCTAASSGVYETPMTFTE
ncbi:uncharacterized protein LOC111262847 [Varroa jacobsoni]|uniref:uncharacterized protein LOC111262847 n=1 Tax=Varroa jacobsoni TaxID=62625 RepID=UPI000BF3E573|nr:uncharacterized protein LOC111262847 [Varroa jacobsoni]